MDHQHLEDATVVPLSGATGTPVFPSVSIFNSLVSPEVVEGVTQNVPGKPGFRCTQGTQGCLANLDGYATGFEAADPLPIITLPNNMSGVRGAAVALACLVMLAGVAQVVAVFVNAYQRAVSEEVARPRYSFVGSLVESLAGSIRYWRWFFRAIRWRIWLWAEMCAQTYGTSKSERQIENDKREMEGEKVRFAALGSVLHGLFVTFSRCAGSAGRCWRCRCRLPRRPGKGTPNQVEQLAELSIEDQKPVEEYHFERSIFSFGSEIMNPIPTQLPDFDKWTDEQCESFILELVARWVRCPLAIRMLDGLVDPSTDRLLLPEDGGTRLYPEIFEPLDKPRLSATLQAAQLPDDPQWLLNALVDVLIVLHGSPVCPRAVRREVDGYYHVAGTGDVPMEWPCRGRDEPREVKGATDHFDPELRPFEKTPSWARGTHVGQQIATTESRLARDIFTLMRQQESLHDVVSKQQRFMENLGEGMAMTLQYVTKQQAEQHMTSHNTHAVHAAKSYYLKDVAHTEPASARSRNSLGALPGVPTGNR